MRNKNLILVIVLLILVTASGLLLYRAFNQGPVSVISNHVSNEDVSIRNEIDVLHVKLTKALQKLEANGDLQALLDNPQFTSLNTSAEESIKSVVLTPHDTQGKPNPFTPVPRTTSGTPTPAPAPAGTTHP